MASSDTTPQGSITQPLLKRAAVHALWVFLAVRLALFVLGLFAGGLIEPAGGADVPGRSAPDVGAGWDHILKSWERWDALWFLKIATEGYDPDDGSAAFFPLYPMLVRVITPVFFGNELVAALFLSNACAYLSVLLLYLLTTRELGEAVARDSVLYLSVFPTAFYLYAPYSEPLFLALVLGAFLAAREGAWPWAAAAGALATATRSLGIILVLALAVEAVHQAYQTGQLRRLTRSLPYVPLVAVGLLAYLGWWWHQTGEALVPVQAQGHWSREPNWPFLTAYEATDQAFSWPGWGGYMFLDWFVAVPAILAGIWVALRMRPTYSVYLWSSLLISLTFVWERRLFMSLPRFLLVLFPIFWAAAVLTSTRRGLHEAIVAASAALMGIMAVLYVNWYWVF